MAFTIFNRCASSSLDNFISKLCYRWTVLLLIVFSFVVTCKILLGDSLTCYSSDEMLPFSYTNAKCYADGMFTLPSKLFNQQDGSRDSSTEFDSSPDMYRKYQTYYSWVNLLFLVQAFNFYLPHLLWKSYESGSIRKLTDEIQNCYDKEEKERLGLCYVARYVLATQGKHKLYTFLYIFFEGLNYAISLFQALWLVHFFGVTGVPDSLPFTLKTWSDFKSFYFPSEGFCIISRLGPSGNPVRNLFRCEMPLNHLYMKMYLFLHVWYILLTVLCGFVLLYRITLLVPTFRVFVATYAAPLVERSVLNSLCQQMSYSDWFFLTRLRKTMTDVDFSQMLGKIAAISEKKGTSNEKNWRLSYFETTGKECDTSGTTSAL